MSDIFIDFDIQDLDNMIDLWDNVQKKEPTKEDKKKEVVICECGCDKVYGPKNTYHSTWCKKYKKVK